MTTIAAVAAADVDVDVDFDVEVADAVMQRCRCRCRCRIGSHPKNRTIEPKEVEPGSLSLFGPTKICLLASN